MFRLYSQAFSGSTFCWSCYKEDPESWCSWCGTSFYCDRNCQLKHWHEQHKYECIGVSTNKFTTNTTNPIVPISAFDEFCSLLLKTKMIKEVQYEFKSKNINESKWENFNNDNDDRDELTNENKNNQNISNNNSNTYTDTTTAVAGESTPKSRKENNNNNDNNNDNNENKKMKRKMIKNPYNIPQIILLIYKHLTGFEQCLKISKSKYLEFYYRSWCVYGSQETGSMTRTIYYSKPFFYRMVVRNNRDNFLLRIFPSTSYMDESANKKRIQDGDCLPSSFLTDQIQILISNTNCGPVLMGGVESYCIGTITLNDAQKLKGNEWIKLISQILKFHCIQPKYITNIEFRYRLPNFTEKFMKKFEKAKIELICNDDDDE